MLKQFKNIPTQYKSIPFWSWNDKLEIEELNKQIEWMKSCDIGGFFMHARSGLKTKYLSEEWMQCIDACIKKAAELDMDAWLYDENGWPSGFAGGKLLKDKNNCDRYLTSKRGKYDSKSIVSYIEEGGCLIRSNGEKNAEHINIYEHISPSTADVLNDKVVDKFIAATHEVYKQRYKNNLSKYVRGFFTDEPQYFRWKTPYTIKIKEYFLSEYNEDILDGIGLLFEKKEGYQAFRYKYWKGMQSLFLQNFAKKIYDWCSQNNVKLTGHYIEESSIERQMWCCGGVMPYYEYMHVPGIDKLCRNTDDIISPKQIGSVAAQLDKKHVITETFGVCGWDVSPQELKAVAEAQYVCGVNMMCHHLIPYAEYGQRKRDYPAHFTPLHPWVKKGFKNFNGYFNKLGYLLSQSEEIVSAAVLHPLKSAYLYYDKVTDNTEVKELDKSFYELSHKLSAMGLQYHYIDETIMQKHAKVEGKSLICGNCRYEYIILPTIYTMEKNTSKLLREYIKNGGKILITDQKPQYLEGEPYEHDYLISNCTLTDILNSQLFYLEQRDTNIVTSLRKCQNGTYIYAANLSPHKSFDVTFNLKGCSSFENMDLIEENMSVISNNVHFEPAQSYILFLSDKQPQKPQQYKVINISGEFEVINCSGNFLTADKASYSFDGKKYTQEKPVECIFQELLDLRYKGELYLKYNFVTDYLPPNAELIIEQMNNISVEVNGQTVENFKSIKHDKNILKAPINSYFKKGDNEVSVKINFYQSEDVYYALYGENVTESLRNCLVYNTNIEALYIRGDFSVTGEITKGKQENTYIGDNFKIVKRQTAVKNLVTDGYPFFAGEISLRQYVDIDCKKCMLQFDGRLHVAEVFVNGKFAGNIMFNRQIDISDYAVKGKNQIDIKLYTSNRNLLGPFHCKYTEEPTAVGPDTFEMLGSWKDGKSPQYRDSYSFVHIGL